MRAGMIDDTDDPCPLCDGEGAIDDPESNACGGRWFRYCDCPAGDKAESEDLAWKQRYRGGWGVVDLSASVKTP